MGKKASLRFRQDHNWGLDNNDNVFSWRGSYPMDFENQEIYINLLL